MIFALRKQVEQVTGEVRFVLEAPDSLPMLPAAVEVAAYRIIQ
ncbi:hypothetical protein [Paenibacillus harenae]|uniref:Uncharacterized protein n=1 Tax=Paenibacillus harenae TaxID=306543 RepID=A0ABT9TYT7_PAEHA|nr:hypothetical protein [Paenibacillus harenae]MDQ0112506.1 hypothetical protein [Paenibacillus harenae]